jgi:hypothetical protein
MDPNAEERTPSAQIAEVDVSVESAVSRSCPDLMDVGVSDVQPAPPQRPLFDIGESPSASSIFRQAFDAHPPPVTNGRAGVHVESSKNGGSRTL